MKELEIGQIVRVKGESPSEFFQVRSLLVSGRTGEVLVRLLSYKNGCFKHVRPERITHVRKVPLGLRMPGHEFVKVRKGTASKAVLA